MRVALKRDVRQIAVVSKPGEPDRLYALCNDGTILFTSVYDNGDANKWVELMVTTLAIPQREIVS